MPHPCSKRPWHFAGVCWAKSIRAPPWVITTSASVYLSTVSLPRRKTSFARLCRSVARRWGRNTRIRLATARTWPAPCTNKANMSRRRRRGQKQARASRRHALASPLQAWSGQWCRVKVRRTPTWPLCWHDVARLAKHGNAWKPTWRADSSMICRRAR